MVQSVIQQLQEHRSVVERMENDLAAGIADLATRLAQSLLKGGKLLVMGNGGSAADAQHFAAEIVGRFKLERSALPAVALTTDSSILTAIGNDYSFEQIFSRQVEALACSGDVVVGISTSGNSPNVLVALELARQRGCLTVGFLGKDGGSIAHHCDIPLVVPSADTPRIQEGHIAIIHIVCDLVEKSLFL